MTLDRGVLPHLDRERIMAFYRASPGHEEATGKFVNPHSSAALAANFFGFFIDRPNDFPGLPGLVLRETIRSVLPEQSLRFPWTGGMHPWLDAVIDDDTSMVAVESKRYEPFRSTKAGFFAPIHFQQDWGPGMAGFADLRDAVHHGSLAFRHLDAVQLIKHAFGLVTQSRGRGLRPVLYYLYAEPSHWAGDRIVPRPLIHRHRAEIETFAGAVAGGEVLFVAGRYADVLADWKATPTAEVRRHAEAVLSAFAPL